MPNAPPSASKELVLGQSASRLSLGCPNRYSTTGCRSVAQALRVLWCYCIWYYAMDGAVGHPKHRSKCPVPGW